MAPTRNQKAKAAPPPPRTSTGLKLLIGPAKMSVLQGLDELALISRTSAEDEEEEEEEEEEEVGILATPKSLKHKHTSEKVKGECTIHYLSLSLTICRSCWR